MKFLTAFLVLLFPSIAIAAEGITQGTQLATNVLSAVALNGAAGTRTMQLRTDGYPLVTFWVNYTHANNGSISIECTGGPSSTDADYALTTGTVSTGVYTVSFAKATTSTLTTDKKFGITIDVGVARYVSCVISHDGTPSSSDKVSVTVEMGGR